MQVQTEHKAALLTLGDVHRSDVVEARKALASLDESSAVALLDRVMGRELGQEVGGAESLLLRTLKAELSPDRVSRSVALLAEYRRSGIRPISLWDSDYPQELRGIDNPPLVLIVWGTVFPGARRIAIVGTRRAGEEGARVAREYAHDLAQSGWTIVSGLARGIDTNAHVGALDAGGTTLAVLAGHIRHVFPPENAHLYDSIRLSGAVVGEVTPFTAMHRGRFIERNRITSGVSEAVLIPEFHGSGGTLQQVNFALAQRRPILTVRRGAGSNPTARRGVETLLRLGAVEIGDPSEVSQAIDNARESLGNHTGSKRRSAQTKL